MSNRAGDKDLVVRCPSSQDKCWKEQHFLAVVLFKSVEFVLFCFVVVVVFHLSWFRFERSLGWAVVTHAFNPSIWESEAGRFLGSRPAWSTE